MKSASISTLLSLSLLVACDSHDTQQWNSAPDPSTPTLGQALHASPDSHMNLESLNKVAPKIAKIVIDFPEEKNEYASVTVCTDYQPTGDSYTINLESCTMAGELWYGSFNRTVNVRQQEGTVLAVVLFENINKEPEFKEFTVSENSNNL